MSSSPSSDLPVTQATENGKKVVQANARPSKKGLKFWLVILSMCTCIFLSYFELFSVSTALPTIADALHATQFTWVGTAYALASAIFHPMGGGLAQMYIWLETNAAVKYRSFCTQECYLWCCK